MKRRESAVANCVEDTAFSPVTASRAKAAASSTRERLETIGKTAGFDYFLLSAFPRGDRTAFVENHLVTNWPHTLLSFYEEADLFYCSHLVTKLKRTILPIYCEEGPFGGTAANQESRRLTALFQMHGLKNTLAFTLHDADLKQYIFAFSGSCPMPSHEQVMTMIYGSMELLDSFEPEIKSDRGPTENLTRREVECLRWSAAGKSSDEIAIILDLSSHTVVGYLKSAMRKLDSVNRMQAVARAFRYRLL